MLFGMLPLFWPWPIRPINSIQLLDSQIISDNPKKYNPSVGMEEGCTAFDPT